MLYKNPVFSFETCTQKSIGTNLIAILNNRAHAETLPEENMKLNEPKPVLKTPRTNNMKATYKDAKLDPDAPAFAPNRRLTCLRRPHC